MSQNAVNPLSPISKNIQSTVNLSRQCIQFTPVKVHSNTSTLYIYIYPLEYYIVPVQSDWLNSALSPVVYGDIALSINTQYNTIQYSKTQ